MQNVIIWDPKIMRCSCSSSHIQELLVDSLLLDSNNMLGTKLREKMHAKWKNIKQSLGLKSGNALVHISLFHHEC